MTTCDQVIANSNAAFGTSGVRGLVEDLDDATCFAYTLAFLDYLKQHHGLKAGETVMIGHDLRPSSPRIAGACMAAIKHADFTCCYCGEIPTPALAFAAQQVNQPVIMVTGSHIPFDRNGIKFYRTDGELMKEDEQPIITNNAEFPDDLFVDKSLKAPASNPNPSISAAQHWESRYERAFPDLLAGMRIGHYQHSAAGRDLLTQILTKLGAEVVQLGRSDAFIPIDTEAVAEADKVQAKAWRDQHELDAIISTDGDGDRPLLADEKGIYFRGDMLGILAGLGLAADTVATPVSTNTALEKSGKFSHISRTKIGSPHVIAAMQKAAEDTSAIVVGFEPNGGFLTASDIPSPNAECEIIHLPTRDALLPVLATISLAKQQNIPLSKLADLVPKRCTASDRLENTPTADSNRFISNLKQSSEKTAFLTNQNTPPVHVDTTDGLRLTFEDDAIVHLRPSGNAPELRIYVEGASEAGAAHLLAHAKLKVREAIGQSSG